MNFSFMIDGAAMTGSISPEAMNSMVNVFGTFFGGMAIVGATIWLAVIIFMLISRSKVFKKAGLPGWGILIPIYNISLIFKLGGLSGRWTLSIFFPPLLIVMMIINIFNIAKRFGKHWTFGLGMLFIKIIFIPILAFDNSKYIPKKSNKPIVRIVPTNKVFDDLITKPIAKPTAKKVVKKVVKKAPAKKAKPLSKKK